jgi:hypothetical protein
MDIKNFNKHHNSVRTEAPEEVKKPSMECDVNLDGTEIEASEICNTLATAEGKGAYTQKNKKSSASGRYQFTTGTAIDVIQKLGYASNKANAGRIWSNCRRSSAENCKKVQDAMCNSYSKQIVSSLKNYGIKPTVENIYLAWNQGAGGSNVIWESIKSGQPVTNPKVLSNMKGQAWKFSPDGKTYYANMVNYLKRQGVNLTG